MKPFWTAEAISDLTDIRRFSIQRWGRDVAMRYMADLRDSARLLADDPRRARYFRGPYSLFRVRSHVLVIRWDDDNARLAVVRVLHSSMDMTRHLPNTPKDSE